MQTSFIDDLFNLSVDDRVKELVPIHEKMHRYKPHFVFEHTDGYYMATCDYEPHRIWKSKRLNHRCLDRRHINPFRYQIYVLDDGGEGLWESEFGKWKAAPGVFGQSRRWVVDYHTGHKIGAPFETLRLLRKESDGLWLAEIRHGYDCGFRWPRDGRVVVVREEHLVPDYKSREYHEPLPGIAIVIDSITEKPSENASLDTPIA